MIILFSILWLIYASLDGIMQAFYYDLYPYKNRHPNIHWLFTIQRFITCLGFTLALLHEYELYQGLIFMVACSFMFSLFHNGLYHTVRNMLDEKIYKERFFANSTTSKAVINLPFSARLILFIIGLSFIIGLIYEHSL